MTLRLSPLLLVSVVLLAFSAGAVPAQDAAKFRLKPGAQGKLCLGCHTDFEATMAKAHVHTPAKTGDCASCHDAHASEHGKLLEAEPDAICLQCHDDLVPPNAMSSHDAAASGKCVDCHDPHASEHENILRADGNRLCLDCHTDLDSAIEAASVSHPPVSRDCLDCHTPHASTVAPALLSKPLPELCVGCHNPQRAGFVRDHMDYDVSGSDCGSCHDPHGSKHKGLLWASLHSPVERRMCAQCHGQPDSATALKTKHQGADLCRGCHNDLFNSVRAKRDVHGPMLDAKSCGNCHEPHAAPVDKLLSSKQGVLCLSCHQDVARRHERSKVKHEPVVDAECVMCHDPHAADETHLLTAGNVEVCGTCHDWRQHSAHPMGEETADPRNGNLTVDCLSCHRNHGTAEDKLSWFDPKKDLCVRCHEQTGG